MKAANARAAALERLIAAHQDEWEAVYAEERQRQGLRARPMTDFERALKRENVQLKAKLREAGLEKA